VPRPSYDFENSLGYWVIPAAHALDRALNEELVPLGVTVRQWQVIACLILRGGACQAELARLLRVEAPTLKGILDRMERDGWIERCPCPDDRRRNVIRLKPAVVPAWRRMAACARRVRRRALRGITRGQFETLRATLAAVRGNLEGKEAGR
jgi:MarR family transcriptional regulator for hemolysin